MEIPKYTVAYLWGINAFKWDYIKYAEALYSNKECKQYYPDWYSEEKKEELITNFLSKSNKYYDQLQYRVNQLPADWWIWNLTNDIVVFVWKIIDWIWIK